MFVSLVWFAVVAISFLVGGFFIGKKHGARLAEDAAKLAGTVKGL